jgi:AbrB family looped-hinge helix DNA binding protein
MSTGSEDAETTRVTDKGQTTIPQSLREKYGIEAGDTVIWEDTDEGLVVRKVIEDAGRGLWVDEELSEADREAVAEELEAEIRERRETDWAVE